MATFGKKAVELVKEIASADGSNLPAFAEEGVRLVLNDIYEHQAAIDGLVAGTAELERQRLGLSPDDELPDGEAARLRGSSACLGRCHAVHCSYASI